MGYGQKTFLQNFLETAIQLSPGGYSWDGASVEEHFPSLDSSVSIPCSMKSLMKPGTAALHGVPAL